MAALQDHARLGLFVDTNWAVEITAIHMTTDSGQNRVDLLNEGLAGFTPGSGDVQIDVGFAVPLGGSEYPWQEKCAKGEYVDMQLIQGAQQYAGRGKLLSVDVGQSVNASVEGSAKWLGEMKPFSS